MKHYIDKDALVAEMEKIYEKYNKQRNSEYMSTSDFICIELRKLLSSLDTLEVKEVDLEKKLDSMKSPEESLGIDSDTYNKIVDECVYGEQKPTEWSEEDEKQARQIERIVHNGCTQKLQKQIADWFKALKNKYTWKPSEEQINTLEQWLKDNQYKGDARYCYPIFDSLYQDLKKLKGE